MDIKPETVKKVAYPALAVVAAAALSACEPETAQPTGGLVPQRLGGDVPAPAKQLPDAPTPPEDIDQGIPGEPPIDSSKIQTEE